MKSYLFLVGYDEDGPFTDSMLDVTPMKDVTAKQYENVTAIQKRMGLDVSERESLLKHASYLALRAKMVGMTLHSVHLDGGLEREVLDDYLKSLAHANQLKQFLKQSRI